MALAFWLACAFVAYVYVGYPAVLHVWAKLRASREPGAASPDLPRVSFVIAARNEARRIVGRVENIEQLDYPAGKRQIILVSDGSTDDTHDVFEQLWAGERAFCLEMPEGGKARALNAGVTHATGDLI